MKKNIFQFWVALIFLSAIMASLAGSDNSADKKIVLIEIRSTINPATFDYIRTGMDKAKENSAEALVILLDTPGGLLSSTKEIVQLILNSSIPVVIYVYPSGATATSAGVFITLSANIAAMAPGTSIGAAHPVLISPGGNPQEDTNDEKKSGDQEKFNEKVENFASSFIESIAEKRKRNTKWAIEAVRSSASITSTEALKINVIDVISPGITELLNEIDGRVVELPEGKKVLKTKGAIVESLDMNFKQKLIDTLSVPDIAFLLISLGSLGLLLEFYNPGLIFPGVAGAICLLLGMVSLQILSFNYAGLALLVLSILLLILEIYVTSFGILGVGGLISFIFGALLLFDTPQSDVRVGFDVVIAATLAIGLFFLFIAYYLVKAQRSRGFVGFEGLMGEEGVAVTDIENGGKIFIHGEYWDAESDEKINQGDKIKVVEVKSGFRLKIRRFES